MIWVDGYKWPPDLHGSGSEDYLNQGWGMQANAFLHNGSSIFEGRTLSAGSSQGLWTGKHRGGCQTSYVFHIENPVWFTREIKVTIEHGHGNHLANEMSSVAYSYAARPTRVAALPPVELRMPVPRETTTGTPYRPMKPRPVKATPERRRSKARWKKKFPPR